MKIHFKLRFENISTYTIYDDVENFIRCLNPLSFSEGIILSQERKNL